MGEAGTKPVCSATEADKSKTSAEPELNPPVTGGMFSLLVLPRLRESSAGDGWEVLQSVQEAVLCHWFSTRNGEDTCFKVSQ